MASLCTLMEGWEDWKDGRVEGWKGGMPAIRSRAMGIAGRFLGGGRPLRRRREMVLVYGPTAATRDRSQDRSPLAAGRTLLPESERGTGQISIDDSMHEFAGVTNLMAEPGQPGTGRLGDPALPVPHVGSWRGVAGNSRILLMPPNCLLRAPGRCEQRPSVR